MFGKGIFEWEDGRRYEGEWKDDKKGWENSVNQMEESILEIGRDICMVMENISLLLIC